MDKLLTLKETAKSLRVSERTVLRYIEKKKLRASNIGVWRIREKDVALLLRKTSNIKKHG